MSSTKRSRLILFRPGQTVYSGEYPDLTEEGRCTIRQLAKRLAGLVVGEIKQAHCSRAARAHGTLDIVCRGLGVQPRKIERGGIFPIEIIDSVKAQRFFSNLRRRSGAYPVETAYLEQEGLYGDRNVLEPKSSVDTRTFIWFRQLAKDLTFVAVEDETVLVSTHFEVMTTLVEFLYGRGLVSDPVRHGEELVLDIGPTKRPMFVNVRGEFRGIAAVREMCLART